MKNVNRIVGVLGVVIMLSVACKKDDNNNNAGPLEVKVVTNFAADTITGFSATGRPIGSGRFTYFSFRDNAIVTGSDTLTNKWDIAIREFFIKVNGGTSATGGGTGAVLLANSTFEAYTEVPANETGFLQDNAPNFAINPAPGNWYNYNPATFLALPIPGKIFVVRTADNRYAKMEITSLYRNGVTPDVALSPAQKALNQYFYQFRFVFQANGSKTLE